MILTIDETGHVFRVNPNRRLRFTMNLLNYASTNSLLLAAALLSSTTPALGQWRTPTLPSPSPARVQQPRLQPTQKHPARVQPASHTAKLSPTPAPSEYAMEHHVDYGDGDYADGGYGLPGEVGCCDVVSSCGESCCNVGCGDACGCGDMCGCGSPCSCYWVELDALIWWTRGMDVPPLATTGSTTGRGVLGAPDTQVLYGDEALLDDSLFGGRFRIGSWLNTCQTAGFEVSYLRLEEGGDGFSASNADYAVLARPIFNTSTSAQDALNIALPGLTSGSLQIDAESQFDALDATLLLNISQHRGGRCDFVIGYRRLELADSLTASQSTLSLAGPTSGTAFNATDRFSTRNTFNGGLFGMRFKNQLNCCWSLESSIGVALGGVERRASVGGSTTATSTGNVVTTTAGGLLAQPTNIGDYSENDFSASYEVGVKLKRRLTERCDLTVGYTYLAWNDVYRVGDQINTNVNPTQLGGGTLVGSATPNFPGDSSSYWAQGINLGLEATF